MKRRVASLLGALVLLTSAVMMAGCPQSAKPDIRKYKITLNQGEHGTVTVDPVLPKDGMVAQYAKLTFTATPDEGYELAGWTGATPDNADIHKATLTVAADATITATFKKKPEIKKYKITLNQGEHGTVTVDPVLPKDGMVEQYTTLTFTATPENGYEVEWTGAAPNSADKNKATLTVMADASVTPVFKKTGNSTPEIKKYKITLNQGEHGAVTVEPPLPADGIVAKDTVLTFTAMPDADYETEWTGAAPDAGDKNKATLTVTAHTTVSVTFKEKAADVSLLQIDYYGKLTGVTDRNALVGSLAIPNTVTGIGADAFVDCSKLTSVTMPETVTWIGDGAFKGCLKLTNVTIGTEVTHIGYRAFQNCPSLTSITIPDNVIFIRDATFQDCTGLTTLTIGKGVGSIDSKTFKNCSSLERITIKSTSLYYIAGDAFENCTDITSLTIGESVTTINNFSVFSKCPKLNAITVEPENAVYCSEDNIVYTKDKTKLVFAAPHAISGEFTIPDSVTTIDEAAFFGCRELTGITIGKNLTAFYSYTFSGCSKLSSITVDPDNATYCSVDNIIYTKDKTDIILVPYGLTGPVRIPDSVTEIGDSAFWGCHALSAVTIGTGVTKIGGSAFTHCTNLTDITIPASVVEIGNSAFSYCHALSAVTIGARVTKIGSIAFAHCTNLTGITIPDSVTEIGHSAFSDCSALSAVTIGTGVTKIGSMAFEHCTNLTGITIPDSVTEIGDAVFWNCSALSAVTIGNNVTKIGSMAFASCTNLTGITIPDSVTEIGHRAFVLCSALSTVTIGNNVTKIGGMAFTHCTNLTDMTIPDSVAEIGDSAFSDCSALSTVTIGTGITKIESNAFSSCSSLGTITIKSSVLTDISNDAFENIKADAQFTVKTEAVKTLLTTQCNIEESKITVDENL